MNRSTSILIVVVVLCSAFVLAYGSQLGFVVIDNSNFDPNLPTTTTTTEPTTATGTEPVIVDPTFSVVVKDTQGIAIDWTATDQIVSGTIEFEVAVTNAGSNTREISDLVLKVYTASNTGQIDEYKGTFVFDVVTDQEEYDLDWDTTEFPNGQYVLQVEYLLVADDGGGDDGGGYATAFSMGLDTSESGVAGVNLLSLVEGNYVIPLLSLIFVGAAIVYVVLRFRR